MAEQGFTALTSSDLINSSASATTSGSVRLSRRDIPPGQTIRSIPTTSVDPITGQSFERPLKDCYTRHRQLSPGRYGPISRATSSGPSGSSGPQNFLICKSRKLGLMQDYYFFELLI